MLESKKFDILNKALSIAIYNLFYDEIQIYLFNIHMMNTTTAYSKFYNLEVHII
jgi:hypothetical protein